MNRAQAKPGAWQIPPKQQSLFCLGQFATYLHSEAAESPPTPEPGKQWETTSQSGGWGGLAEGLRGLHTNLPFSLIPEGSEACWQVFHSPHAKPHVEPFPVPASPPPPPAPGEQPGLEGGASISPEAVTCHNSPQLCLRPGRGGTLGVRAVIKLSVLVG